MTTLGQAIAAALPTLRAEAESMMVDTCRITAGGSTTWDEATGVYTTTGGATVYEGACRLRMPRTTGSPADVGETTWAVDDAVVSLPIVGSEDVERGHVVEMLTSPNDADVVGLLLTVQSGHWQTNSTARRVPCKVVTRDA